MWIFSRTTLRGILHALKRFRQRSSSYVIEKSRHWHCLAEKSIVYFLLHWKAKSIIYIFSPFLSIFEQPDLDYFARGRLIVNNNTDILTCYTMNRLVLIYNVEKSTLFNCPLTYCIVNHMSTKTYILFWKFTFRQVCMQAILTKSLKNNFQILDVVLVNLSNDYPVV